MIIGTSRHDPKSHFSIFQSIHFVSMSFGPLLIETLHGVETEDQYDLNIVFMFDHTFVQQLILGMNYTQNSRRVSIVFHHGHPNLWTAIDARGRDKGESNIFSCPTV